MFLLAVAILGFFIGIVISLVLSSASTEVVFGAILVATIALVILANSLLKAIEGTEGVRNAAAVVPVPPSIGARTATAVAKLSRSEHESESDQSGDS